MELQQEYQEQDSNQEGRRDSPAGETVEIEQREHTHSCRGNTTRMCIRGKISSCPVGGE